jgi:ABC-type sugar transport system permease subunit
MDKLRSLKFPFTVLAVVLIVLLAWTLRWRAVTMLPGDYDEDDYLRAAQQYAALLRTGDWQGFTETNYRPEHPPLAKIVFGFSLLSAPEAPLLPDRPTTAQPDKFLPKEQLRAARTSGAMLGTLTVALLALVNPLAGLFLAVHGMTIKYVDQVMLEALPALTSLVMVLAYQKSRGDALRRPYWLVFSAVFLGLTAASKYLYCAVGIAILVDWYLDYCRGDALRRPYRAMLLWGLLAIAVFFAANPYLWPDPIGRLKESVFYHVGYSSGASEVQQANFPVWQPLVWLNTSPYSWHEGVFLLGLDPLIALFAAFGLVRLWRKERVYALWLGLGLFFLLLWPTKWPQYILMLTVPLSLAAAHGVLALIIQPIQNWWAAVTDRAVRRTVLNGTFSNPEHPRLSEISFKVWCDALLGEKPVARTDLRQALPWLVPGLLAFAVFTLLPLLFQFGVSLTDFNSVSIRDGLNGGIWREVWGGLTGQIPPASTEFPFRSKEVNFTGPSSYLPVLDYITGGGILVFNLLWTIVSVALQTALGLGAALLLWQPGIKLRRGWELLFILPWAIPEMIGALMWLNIFAPTTGWLSLAVQTHGDQIPFAFFTGWERSPSLWALVLLIATLWYGFPFMMLAASAGLKLVPLEVFDAAQLDGANAWQTFRHVTWPLLMPLVVPAIIIRGIFAFNQFYLFQVFQIGQGTLATLSYNFFNPSGYFINGQFAISAVLNILTMLILIGFVILFNRWSKAREGVTYA